MKSIKPPSGHAPFLIICSSVLWASAGLTRPQYVQLVPTPFECETCHNDPRMRQFRNGFGIDFATQRTVWFNDANDPDCPTDCTGIENCPPRTCSGMCPLDSDADGLSNGVELGDPDCTWRPGDPMPRADTTHPGDTRDPDRCGNGELDAGEECDGDALGDENCADRGFLDGELGCRANCTYDDSICEAIPEPDAEIIDAAVVDAEVPDEGMTDISSPDEGPMDAGPSDEGNDDAEATETDGSNTDQTLNDMGDEANDAQVMNDAGEANMDDVASPSSNEGGCSVSIGQHPFGPLLSLMGLFLIFAVRMRR